MLPLLFFTLSLISPLHTPFHYFGDEQPNARAETGWQYQKSTTKAGEPVQTATLSSSNQLQFPFPFQGGSRINLTLRKKGSDTQAFLEVGQVLFNRSYQNGRASLSFDGSRPVDFALSAAANGRANIVFFDATTKLVEQLKKARRVVVRLHFAHQPKREIQFRTAGLRWSN